MGLPNVFQKCNVFLVIFWNVLTSGRPLCLISLHEKPLWLHCTCDFASMWFGPHGQKLLAESQTHTHTSGPRRSHYSKCQTGTTKKLQCTGMQPSTRDRQSQFSCIFLSSRGVSNIQHNIKFLACLFNLRNCKNDDRWSTELTYVLYSSLKKGASRNFEKGRSYSMQVAIKIF